MSTNGSLLMNRLEELLLDEAVEGLDLTPKRELSSLLQEDKSIDPDGFMRTASLLQLGLLKRDHTAQRKLPDTLKKGLVDQGKAALAHRNDPTADLMPERPDSPRPIQAQRNNARKNLLASAGWLLAVGFAVAFIVLRGDPPLAQDAGIEPRAQLAELLRDEKTITAPWAAAQQSGYADIRGEVVWNNQRQLGFLRLAGLPMNDSQAMQYQLWIIDPTRDTHPVDGGVFDVTQNQGETLVPIKAKLRIIRPQAFAITAEKPGGVVVSDGPLLIVAPVEG